MIDDDRWLHTVVDDGRWWYAVVDDGDWWYAVVLLWYYIGLVSTLISRAGHFEARSKIGKLKMKMDKPECSHLDKCKQTKLAMDFLLRIS